MKKTGEPRNKIDDPYDIAGLSTPELYERIRKVNAALAAVDPEMNAGIYENLNYMLQFYNNEIASRTQAQATKREYDFSKPMNLTVDELSQAEEQAHDPRRKKSQD